MILPHLHLVSLINKFLFQTSLCSSLSSWIQDPCPHHLPFLWLVQRQLYQFIRVHSAALECWLLDCKEYYWEAIGRPAVVELYWWWGTVPLGIWISKGEKFTMLQSFVLTSFCFAVPIKNKMELIMGTFSRATHRVWWMPMNPVCFGLASSYVLSSGLSSFLLHSWASSLSGWSVWKIRHPCHCFFFLILFLYSLQFDSPL